MIEFIGLLIESYERENRRNPDCIVCNYEMARAIMLSIKHESQSSKYLPYTPCEYYEQETCTSNIVNILGLRLLPNGDMIPGAIIVCRMDESGAGIVTDVDKGRSMGHQKPTLYECCKDCTCVITDDGLIVSGCVSHHADGMTEPLHVRHVYRPTIRTATRCIVVFSSLLTWLAVKMKRLTKVLDDSVS